MRLEARIASDQKAMHVRHTMEMREIILGTVMDAVDQVRSDAKSFYQQIEASTSKSQAAMRSNLQDAATQAQQLASSLRSAEKNQSADATRCLEHAASLLDSAAESARGAAQATDANLRKTSMTILEQTRDALHDVSEAVAAKRAAAKPQA